MKHLFEFIIDPIAIHRGKMPVRNVFVIETLRNMITENKVCESIKTPFLILHGENDKMCEPSGSTNFVEQSPFDKKKVKIYPELTHMLIHDKLYLDDMANEIITWFDTHNIKNLNV